MIDPDANVVQYDFEPLTDMQELMVADGMPRALILSPQQRAMAWLKDRPNPLADLIPTKPQETDMAKAGPKELQRRALREQRHAETTGTAVAAPEPKKPAAPAKEPTVKTKTKAAKPAAKKAAKKAATSTRRQKAPSRASAARPEGRRQYPWKDAEASAKAGKMPPALDFAAECHAPYRTKLAELEQLAKAKDIKGLKAVEIPTYNASCKSMDRWRNLAVTALSS